MSEKAIYPEDLPNLNSDSIDQLGHAIHHALEDYDEPSDVLWGAMYQQKGQIVFRCDTFMDYTLKDYEDALNEHQR